jgi:hypothetical protein
VILYQFRLLAGDLSDTAKQESIEKTMKKIALLTALLVMGGAALMANPSRQGVREILERTARKPQRNEPFAAGSVGGTWNSAMTEDPKSFSFNHLIAEQDGTLDVVYTLRENLYWTYYNSSSTNMDFGPRIIYEIAKRG